MVKPISFAELERLLADESVPDEEIAPYLRAAPVGSLPFVPIMAADEGLVSLPSTRGIIGLTVKSLNERANRQRRAAFKKKIDGGWTGLRLLAEGDSWFLYPVLLRDVIDQLGDHYAILCDSAAGDTLENMARGVDHLSDQINEHRLHGMLLSAGGNDIAGEALQSYLVGPRGDAWFPEAFIGRHFDAFLESTLARLDALASRLLARHPEIKIFCHGYDWPHPRNGGRWLAPAMTVRQIPEDMQAGVLKIMIDRYYGMLLRLQKKCGDRLIVLDCRGLIGPASEWFDELHPNNQGFQRVADRFRDTIDAAYGISRQRTPTRCAAITWGSEWERINERTRRTSLAVGSVVTIGRSPECGIVAADESVSRKHAQLRIEADVVQVEDLDSVNGTFINAVPIRTARWRPGERLRVGEQIFTLGFTSDPVGSGIPLPAASPRRSEADAEMATATASSPADEMRADVMHDAATPDAEVSLEIELIRGDIADVPSRAYLVGVFHQINPLSSRGACNAIDVASDGAISAMAQTGLFNGQLGEVTVLPLVRQRGVMELILFAGLGVLSSFTERSLEVIGENVARLIVTAQIEDFATIPIGGNAGISARRFAMHFLAGFLRGLKQAPDGNKLRRIQICEIEHDRFDTLRHDLQALAQSDFFTQLGCRVSIRDDVTASAPQPPSRAARVRGPTDDLVPVYLQVSSSVDGAFEFFILSAALGATIQSHRVEINADKLADLTTTAARAPRFDAVTGAALAGVYLPAPLRDQIKRSLAHAAAHLVIIHDRASSGIPWETFYIDAQCPALEHGISRLYRLSRQERVSGRPTLPRMASMRMLVVENPTEDLAGAGSEGKALAELFSASRGHVTVLRGREATRANVLSELSSGTLDLLHYAGHADFEETAPHSSGLLCCDGRITAADLREIGRVPRLIFLNACESGRLRKLAGPPQDSTILGLNVGLAEGFLLGGVSNFIGTYWPVGDAAAMKFSLTLYHALLDGQPIGNALRSARREIHGLGPRDWANYLHFGDPLYRVRQA